MYTCGHCVENFTSSQSLDCHMQIHTGVLFNKQTRVNAGSECLLWNVSTSPSVVAEVVRYRCENCDHLFNQIIRCSDTEFAAANIHAVQRCVRCHGNKTPQAGLSGIHSDNSSLPGGNKIESGQLGDTEKCAVTRGNYSRDPPLEKGKLKDTGLSVHSIPAAEMELLCLAYGKQQSRYARLTRLEAKCTEDRSGHCHIDESHVSSPTSRATCTRNFTEQIPHPGLFHPEKNLKRHIRVHAGEKPYLCKNPFSQSSNRSTHMRTHSGVKPYQCKVCMKQFSRADNLTTHKMTHTGEKPYQCKVCKKQFSQSSNLTTHMKTHTGEKPYQCKMCKKQFCTAHYLKVHTRVHTGEKPYQCEVCKNTFTQASHLTTHVRTHTEEKPYQCEVCKNQFSQPSHLSTHMRTHTGEKPYQCCVCMKRFGRSDVLTRHMSTHTGEKPYQCIVCKQQFSRSINLTIHMRTHTGWGRSHTSVRCAKTVQQNGSPERTYASTQRGEVVSM